MLIDGIYANGPVIEICRKYEWQFMIVLKDDSLPSVWEEFNALKHFDDNRNNRHSRKWGNRIQRFTWVNDICYMYEQTRKEETVHVVVCEEEWEEVDENAQIITQHKKFAWLSSEPLNRLNLHQRCNLGGRSRWVIENGDFLVEKRHEYQYEHAFSFNWNAVRGFHALMRIGTLAMYITTIIWLRNKISQTKNGCDSIRKTAAQLWMSSKHGSMPKSMKKGSSPTRVWAKPSFIC